MPTVLSNETCIRYVDASDLKSNPNNRYFILLLDLALEASSEQFGEYQLCPKDIPITQSRQFIELNKGRIDVFWSLVTEQRNAQTLTIPIPLIMGAYGLRVLVINNALQEPVTEQILRQKTILVGRDWPDRAILQQNGFNVVFSEREDDFYRLVQSDKNLLFPRGITEAWSELEHQAITNLKVESSLLLRYPIAMQFFVAKSNQSLAQRLQFGLNRVMSETAPLQLFRQFKLHEAMLSKANLSSRHIIELQNPETGQTELQAQLLKLQDELINIKP